MFKFFKTKYTIDNFNEDMYQEQHKLTGHLKSWSDKGSGQIRGQSDKGSPIEIIVKSKNSVPTR